MSNMTNPVPTLRLLGSPFPRASDEHSWMFIGDMRGETLAQDIGEVLSTYLTDMQEDEEPFCMTFKTVMLTDKQVEGLN